MVVRTLQVLDKSEKEDLQRRGYMYEHLLCLYSIVSDQVMLYNDDFPIFLNRYGEAAAILFGLGGNRENRFNCVRELTELPIKKLNIISPISIHGVSNVKTRYVDWDFHIRTNAFDFDMRGNRYKNIRNRLKQAEKMGYHIKLTKTFTPNHIYILSRHMTRKKLDFWDYEELLSLERFFREHDHGLMMEAYKDDRLVGFDIVDFFEFNRTMAVPLGIYLKTPLISDFMMYENLKFARDKGYEWVDVGPTCRSAGLRRFKEKWLARPRFKLYIQTLKVRSQE